MTIVEFIEARLAEDEQTAREADGSNHVHAIGDRLECGSTRCAHDVRHNPARVLRQCATLRAMLRHADEAGDLDMTVDAERAVGPRTDPYIDDLMRRDIAAIWSDHPDYKTAWAV